MLKIRYYNNSKTEICEIALCLPAAFFSVERKRQFTRKPSAPKKILRIPSLPAEYHEDRRC